MNNKPEQLGPGGTLVFWFLLIMSACIFAPCVLLPAWRTYQNVIIVEQAETARIEHLRKQLEKQERLAQGLREDPGVVKRAAQRELELTGQNTKAIPVLPVRSVEKDMLASFTPKPPPPPEEIMWLIRRLPQNINYDSIFCKDPSRSLVMFLAAGGAFMAFVLFPPFRYPCDPEPEGLNRDE